MKELIFTKVHPDLGVNAVSARELYLGLELNKSEWSRWAKRNIDENEYFTQGIDFVELVVTPNANNPNPPRDFAISIEMAKHLAMMARTKKSHEYRNYFIELEKQVYTQPVITQPTQILVVEQEAEVKLGSLLNIAKMLKVPEHYAMQESCKQIDNELGTDLVPLLQYSTVMNNISEDEIYLEPTELGKLVGLSAKAFNRELMHLGLQESNNGLWEPIGEGLNISQRHSWTVGNKSGYNLKWKKDAVLKLLEEVL